MWGESACDRDCLEVKVDAYLEAMIADDPSAASFSDDVKYTENIVILTPGQGLWDVSIRK